LHHVSEGHPWFAVHVRAQREKHVATLLGNKGYTHFLPLYLERRKWSDRFQEVELALFPGYLFCQFDPEHRLPILTTPGVWSIAGSGRTPIPVAGSEVEAIQAIVRSGLGTLPWPFLQAGDVVRLAEGPLAGLEGLLVEVKKEQRLVVSVTLLQRSVAVEIDRNWVRPIEAMRRPVEAARIGALAASA